MIGHCHKPLQTSRTHTVTLIDSGLSAVAEAEWLHIITQYITSQDYTTDYTHCKSSQQSALVVWYW